MDNIHIPQFHIPRFNQTPIENIQKKIPENSKKENLNFLCTGNYLFGNYIVFCGLSNLEMI